MTRIDLLRALIRQAKDNDFEFRKWYVVRLTLPWTNFEDAVATLADERRYYSLLFSHEFAQAFWKQGTKVTFVVPTSTYTRVTKNGQVITVKRQGHTRRAAQRGVWQYHLQQMATSDDPLRYIRRFLLVEEDLHSSEIPHDVDEASMPMTDASQLANMDEGDDVPYFEGAGD